MFESFNTSYLKTILVLLAKIIKFYIQVPIVKIRVSDLNRSFDCLFKANQILSPRKMFLEPT